MSGGMDELNPSTPRPAMPRGAEMTEITSPITGLAQQYQNLVGTQYEFEDGIKIGIVAVKQRSVGVFVTYEAIYGGALPRRFVVSIDEFNGQFGHLFGLNQPPKSDQPNFRKL
jgi:hypothetical protein